MARVSWSAAAQYDLVNVVRVRAVIEELRDNAEVTLHNVETVGRDEGIDGKTKTMWHRGFTHEQERQINAGTLPEKQGPQVWDYLLFYRQRGRGWHPGFEVLRVRSDRQVGRRILEAETGYRPQLPWPPQPSP
jgi:hypothetical protein